MNSLGVVLVLVTAALMVWGLVHPRSQWRALVRWRYPRMAEPGPRSYLAVRIACAVVLVVLVALLVHAA